MTLIFKDKTNIWICQQDKPVKVTTVDDPNLITYIPNDDLIYVQSASLITKKQFASWLKGEFQLDNTETTREEEEIEEDNSQSERKYLHPRNNGYITVGDIKIGKGDNAKPLVFTGKYDFIALDELGDDIVEHSAILRGLIKKGRLEIVDEEYVRKNRGKGNTTSKAEAGLQRILLPVGVHAEDAADGSYLSGDDDVAIPVHVKVV